MQLNRTTLELLMEIDNLEQLSQWVADLITSKTPLYLGIDGLPESGKTKLSDSLGYQFHSNVIHLDAFLNQNTGVFFDSLKFDEISKVLSSTKCDVIILEGICLLKVIRHLKIGLDKNIYVKRYSHHGYWEDETRVESDEPIAIQPDLPGAADREALIYHREFDPIENADLIYIRRES